MYKVIIFDLDGTLLNTSKDIQAVLNDSLSHFGLPQISLEKTVEYVGNGAKVLVERAMPADRMELFDDVYSYYRVHFAACDNLLTCLYPDEEQVLNQLKGRGVKFAIVTNKPQNATDGVYSKHLSNFDFDCVLGQTDKFPLKPSPLSTQYIIKSLGVLPEDCLFVGDGETDVQTARAAGIDCLSVLWGYRSREQLEKAGATNFAESYKQLLKFVLNN
jgi:phosphoglycolate phosphatase